MVVPWFQPTVGRSDSKAIACERGKGTTSRRSRCGPFNWCDDLTTEILLPDARPHRPLQRSRGAGARGAPADSMKVMILSHLDPNSVAASFQPQSALSASRGSTPRAPVTGRSKYHTYTPPSGSRRSCARSRMTSASRTRRRALSSSVAPASEIKTDRLVRSKSCTPS